MSAENNNKQNNKVVGRSTLKWQKILYTSLMI